MVAVSANARRMMKDRDRILRAMEGLSDSLVIELVRRADHRASGSATGSSTGRASKGTHSDPTAGAVIASVMGKDADDPVFESIRNVARVLDDMAALSVMVTNSVRFVTDVQQRMKEASVLRCEACQREVMGTSSDRLRSGYCSADYSAWIRQGRPYRASFEIEVRRKRAESQSQTETDMADARHGSR